MGCVSSQEASSKPAQAKNKVSQERPKESVSSASVVPHGPASSTEASKTDSRTDALGASGAALGTSSSFKATKVAEASEVSKASEIVEVPGASRVSEVSKVSGISGVSAGSSRTLGTSGLITSSPGSSSGRPWGPGSSAGSFRRGGLSPSGRSSEPPALTIRRLTEDEIKCVTRNFSTVLGEGGFGKVYKGEMRLCGVGPASSCKCSRAPSVVDQESAASEGEGTAAAAAAAGAEPVAGGVKPASGETNGQEDGGSGTAAAEAGGCKAIPVAVKVLAPHSFQGDYEFLTELVTFDAVRHGNIVELLAYSSSDEFKALIYEYMPYGDVDSLLAKCKKGQATFPWAARLKVAHEVAQAVAFMHSLRYIHRDLKASNVLLTDDLTAKVADFGLAKGIADWRSHVTTRVVGSIGYLDPMYFLSGHVHAKSDVYAFGVFLVELLTGKSVIRDSIHEHVIPTLLQEDEPDLANLVDPSIAGQCRRKDALAVAYIAKYALIKEWDARPTMESVSQKIGNVVNWQRTRAATAAAAAVAAAEEAAASAAAAKTEGAAGAPETASPGATGEVATGGATAAGAGIAETPRIVTTPAEAGATVVATGEATAAVVPVVAGGAVEEEVAAGVEVCGSGDGEAIAEIGGAAGGGAETGCAAMAAAPVAAGFVAVA